MISLVKELIWISILSISAIFIGICSVQGVYAEKFNLDEMSVDLPSQMEMQYQYAPSGEKTFNIVDKRTDAIFGTISFVNYNIGPMIFDKELDYIKQMTFNYQELKRGCDDGLFSIESNYCAVAYYAEKQIGNGFYAMQVSTQIKEGKTALWTFINYDDESLRDSISTIRDIVNTVEPIYYTEEESNVDNPSFDSNRMHSYGDNDNNGNSNSENVPYEDYSSVCIIEGGTRCI